MCTKMLMLQSLGGLRCVGDGKKYPAASGDGTRGAAIGHEKHEQVQPLVNMPGDVDREAKAKQKKPLALALVLV